MVADTDRKFPPLHFGRTLLRPADGQPVFRLFSLDDPAARILPNSAGPGRQTGRTFIASP